MTHEEVVNKLDSETVSYDISYGSGPFPELLRVTLKVQLENYETAVAWLKDLLYGSVFDKERYVSATHICRSTVHTGVTGFRSLWRKSNRTYPS